MSSIAATAISRSWKWTTLSEVAAIITGTTPPTNDLENYGDAVPFVKPTELVDGPIHSAPQGLSAIGLKFARTVPPGAVLVSCIGVLGKTGIARTQVAFNQQINAILFNELVLLEFGLYYAQTLRPWLYGQASATTLPIVNKGKFQRAPFPLMPLDDQRRIVAEIEKQFSRLDEAVANLQRVKANLKRYKAAALVDAVEGELASDRTGWTAVRLGDVASSVRNGISIKPVGESGTRILRISAVRPMALDLSDIRYLAQPLGEFEAFRLAAGDVLFTRYNGSVDLVGVCAAVAELPEPTVYPDKLIRVRVPSEVLLPSFLVIAASTGDARAFIGSRIRTTAGQAGVSGADVKAIPLRVPPLQEQQRIVAEVDRRLSIVREVEAEVDANLKRARALRQAVLARAFGGVDEPVPSPA